MKDVFLWLLVILAGIGLFLVRSFFYKRMLRFQLETNNFKSVAKCKDCGELFPCPSCNKRFGLIDEELEREGI